MKALILERDPGDDLWFAREEGIVIAETDTHYQIKTSFLIKDWYPKDGRFTKCQVIKEVI